MTSHGFLCCWGGPGDGEVVEGKKGERWGFLMAEDG